MRTILKELTAAETKKLRVYNEQIYLYATKLHYAKADGNKSLIASLDKKLKTACKKYNKIEPLNAKIF